MGAKKFDDYLKTRLTKQEVAEIEHMAKLEAHALLILPCEIKTVAARVGRK